jgi:hypothetical protein
MSTLVQPTCRRHKRRCSIAACLVVESVVIVGCSDQHGLAASGESQEPVLAGAAKLGRSVVTGAAEVGTAVVEGAVGVGRGVVNLLVFDGGGGTGGSDRPAVVAVDDSGPANAIVGLVNAALPK